MPRSLIIRVVLVVAVLIAAMVALSRIDATREPQEVVKIIPDNALAR